MYKIIEFRNGYRFLIALNVIINCSINFNRRVGFPCNASSTFIWITYNLYFFNIQKEWIIKVINIEFDRTIGRTIDIHILDNFLYISGAG